MAVASSGAVTSNSEPVLHHVMRQAGQRFTHSSRKTVIRTAIHPAAVPIYATMTASTDPDAKTVLDPQIAEKQRQDVAPGLTMAPLRYTKTLHFVRHGQGFHNVAGHIDHENYKSEEYADAHLTELGWQQAESLGQHVKSTHLPVDLVVVAPLTRALETAVAAFGSHQEPWRCQPEQLLMVPQEGIEGKQVRDG